MDWIHSILDHPVWRKYGLNFVWVLAVLGLSFSVLGSALHWRGEYLTKKENYLPKPARVIAMNQAPAYRIQDAVRANLFGDPAPKAVVKNAPKTTLNLILEGLLWSSDGELARAIIKSNKSRSQLYSVGDSIQGAGARLSEIRNNEVILNRSGALESLALASNKNKNSIITYVDSSAASASPNVSAASFSQRNEPASQPSPISTQAYTPRKIRKPNFSGLDRALKKMKDT